MIKLKRVYDPSDKRDGFRVLVDRLWPRGLKKEDANIDLWMREVAPSSGLRKWFDHDPEHWEEFCHRYAAELDERKDEIIFLRRKGEIGTLTLVYSARETKHNNAVALKRYLESL